jgi:hypothetical protein
MTPRVSMSLKSRASLACFRASFLPDRTKDLSAPRLATAVLEVMLPKYLSALETTFSLPKEWCHELGSRMSQI